MLFCCCPIVSGTLRDDKKVSFTFQCQFCTKFNFFLARQNWKVEKISQLKIYQVSKKVARWRWSSYICQFKKCDPPTPGIYYFIFCFFPYKKIVIVRRLLPLFDKRALLLHIKKKKKTAKQSDESRSPGAVNPPWKRSPPLPPIFHLSSLSFFTSAWLEAILL